MKEAIGTSFVFNLVMIFVGVFIALYVGSIAYTKGYKVKNRIIDIIEKHDGYTMDAVDEIDANLAEIGYQINLNQACEDKVNPEDNQSPIKSLNQNGNYKYCVYEFKTSKGMYYGVTTFIHFDIPLIGQFLEFPVYGETRIIFDKDEVEG